MIVTFTDFGLAGPYVGQLRLALAAGAPKLPVIDLMHDAPAANPKAAAYLLAALGDRLPAGAVLLAVVDPGVGSDRRPVMVQTAQNWLVGPDNGLLAPLAGRLEAQGWFEISWRPEALSASFHGRDLFAPVAARLALGDPPQSLGEPWVGAPVGADWAEDLAEIVYIDRFGNAMTGLRAAHVHENQGIWLKNKEFFRARTFSDAAPGQGFWYENSNGLVEIAVNGGSAAANFDLKLGVPVTFHG